MPHGEMDSFVCRDDRAVRVGRGRESVGCLSSGTDLRKVKMAGPVVMPVTVGSDGSSGVPVNESVSVLRSRHVWPDVVTNSSVMTLWVSV